MKHIISREELIKNLINEWLSMPGKSCGMCGANYFGEQEPCCERPFITDNKGIFKQFHKELQIKKDIQNNKYASTDNKTLRVKLSFPPGLLEYLERAFEIQSHGEKLFNDEHGTTWFAKHFRKYFQVPEEI